MLQKRFTKKFSKLDVVNDRPVPVRFVEPNWFDLWKAARYIKRSPVKVSAYWSEKYGAWYGVCWDTDKPKFIDGWFGSYVDAVRNASEWCVSLNWKDE